MGRHEQREQVFKLLYRVEFHAPEDMPEQIALFRENNEEVPSWQDADAIAARFEKIREKIPELDRLLNENTEGWDTTRMGKVELAVLQAPPFPYGWYPSLRYSHSTACQARGFSP